MAFVWFEFLWEGFVKRRSTWECWYRGIEWIWRRIHQLRSDWAGSRKIVEDLGSDSGELGFRVQRDWNDGFGLRFEVGVRWLLMLDTNWISISGLESEEAPENRDTRWEIRDSSVEICLIRFEKDFVESYGLDSGELGFWVRRNWNDGFDRPDMEFDGFGLRFKVDSDDLDLNFCGNVHVWEFEVAANNKEAGFDVKVTENLQTNITTK